jgi:hypothetical protein
VGCGAGGDGNEEGVHGGVGLEAGGGGVAGVGVGWEGRERFAGAGGNDY